MPDSGDGDDNTAGPIFADHHVQVRLARINASSGLVGALLGAGVALVVALTQMNAQDAQVSKQIQQDQVRFLRDNRLQAYADSLDAYARLNSRLAGLVRAGSVEVQLRLGNDLLSQIAIAREISTRTQLLAPEEIRAATQALNKAYLDYTRLVIDALHAYLRSGGNGADRPPAATGEQTAALDAKGDLYNAWLEQVRASLAGPTP